MYKVSILLGFAFPKGRIPLPNRMNIWKSAKEGVIFNPKIYVADFGNFKQGFLIVKLIQNSYFRVQGIFSTIVLRKMKPRHTLKKALITSHFPDSVKLSGLLQIISHFPDSFTTFWIFPDHLPLSE